MKLGTNQNFKKVNSFRYLTKRKDAKKGQKSLVQYYQSHINELNIQFV